MLVWGYSWLSVLGPALQQTLRDVREAGRGCPRRRTHVEGLGGGCPGRPHQIPTIGPPSCHQTYHTPRREEASSGQESHVNRRPETQATAALCNDSRLETRQLPVNRALAEKNHKRTARSVRPFKNAVDL